MQSEFERTVTLIGEENFQKLQKATVMLVGLGGVGGYAGEALVRSGIGRLIVIDKDEVELSNLNRQIIANQDTVGRKKVEVFAQRAQSINPDVQIIRRAAFMNEENLEEFFHEKVDFVIDAIDTLSSKVALWKYCQDQNIGIISCLGTAKKLDPTRLQITTLAKTDTDPMAKALRQIARRREVDLHIPVVFSREEPINKSSEMLGSMMFVPASAGILCASYVVRQLIDITNN